MSVVNKNQEACSGTNADAFRAEFTVAEQDGRIRPDSR